MRGRPIHHPGLSILNSTPRVSGFVLVIAGATRDKPALIAEVVVGRAIFCLLRVSLALVLLAYFVGPSLQRIS